MANSVVQTCCLIVLTIFVDSGDGRWKRRDDLEHDIAVFKKMAEKIQNELEERYDGYSSKWLEEQIIDSLQQKYRRNTHKNETKMKFIEPSADRNKIFNRDPVQNHKEEAKSYANVISNTLHRPNLNKLKPPSWPKFEDILLQVGKKYDWKNDRWIKMKGKLKDKDFVDISDNSLEFHEKRKFHYKMIKLNKSKNRRNVVVAVSAVR